MATKVEFPQTNAKNDKPTVSLLPSDEPNGKKRKSTVIIGTLVAILVIITACLVIAAVTETWPFAKEAHESKQPEAGVAGQRNDNVLSIAEVNLSPQIAVSEMKISPAPKIKQGEIVGEYFDYNDNEMDGVNSALCAWGCGECANWCALRGYPLMCCDGGLCCCYSGIGDGTCSQGGIFPCIYRGC
eukprot:446079_1